MTSLLDYFYMAFFIFSAFRKDKIATISKPNCIKKRSQYRAGDIVMQ